MRDDELAFDGVPIEAVTFSPNDEAPATEPVSPGAAGIAESFLTEVIQVHQAVLDVHQSVSEKLLASARSAVAEHHPPTRPKIPSHRIAIDASLGSRAPESAPGAPPPEFRPLLRPQLPVGSILMYGAELKFDGTPGECRTGATLLSDFPVPADAWFRSEDRSTLTNLAWQEIGLQAAGRLLIVCTDPTEIADGDLVGRNLEGRTRLTHVGSPLGRTLQVRSELLACTRLDQGLLARIGLVVALDGEPCYEGETVHGFFTPQTLRLHRGLDDGRRVPTWLDRQSSPPPAIKAVPPICDEDRLDLIDELDIVLDGGDHGGGYVLAHKRIDPSAWYFDEHFPGDPVMPGSLGIETMFHTLWAFGIAAGLTDEMSKPSFAPAPGADLAWKYRGQVLPETRQIQAEVHLRSIQREPERVLLHADGSLYCDGLRIYQVDGICVELREEKRRR